MFKVLTKDLFTVESSQAGTMCIQVLWLVGNQVELALVLVFGLNIFNSKEKDYVWHKARHYPVQFWCFAVLKSWWKRITIYDNPSIIIMYGIFILQLIYGMIHV